MGETNKLAPRGWRQWKPDEAKKQLKAWNESGLPAETFARRRGYSSTRLRWWRDRVGEWNEPDSASEARLVPAVVTGLGSSETPQAVVHVPSGGRIEVMDAAAVPAQWVAAVASALTLAKS